MRCFRSRGGAFGDGGRWARRVWAAGACVAVAVCGGCSPKPRVEEAAFRRPAHRFHDATRWVRAFEAPERDRWQRPDHVLEVLGLRPDAVVADIGAGTGYFTVRLARVVPLGHVYAVDIEPDLVRYLRERIAAEGLRNVTVVLAEADDPLLPEPVDVVFLCNTYHHIADRAAYFRRLRPWLRPGGRVVIVDFYKRRLPVGPPPEHKMSAEQVVAEMGEAGYRLVGREEELVYQYILIFARAGRWSGVDVFVACGPGG